MGSVQTTWLSLSPRFIHSNHDIPLVIVSQFKHFEAPGGNWNALCEAVFKFDTRDLSVDKIDALADIMPTESEIKKVRCFPLHRIQ